MTLKETSGVPQKGHKSPNYSALLAVTRILVDETTEDTSLTLDEIMDRISEKGFCIERKTFYRYIQALKNNDIIIDYRLPKKGRRGGYWYRDGWI